jgi:hypothetical protein
VYYQYVGENEKGDSSTQDDQINPYLKFGNSWPEPCSQSFQRVFGQGNPFLFLDHDIYMKVPKARPGATCLNQTVNSISRYVLLSTY